MALRSIHYYLLLTLSCLVLLLQTVVTNHYHQADSYYNAQDSFHVPPSSLTPEKTDTFTIIPPSHPFPAKFTFIALSFPIITPGITIQSLHPPTPSRAPPSIPPTIAKSIFPK